MLLLNALLDPNTATGKLIGQLLDMLPRVGVALLILLVVWILAKFMSNMVDKLLKKTPIDRMVEKVNDIDIVRQANIEIVPSTVLSKILYYLILLFGAVAATDVLAMEAVSNLVTDIIGLVPQLLVAAIVLLVGVFVADFVKDMITTVCQSLGIPSAKMIGGFVFWFIFLTALVSAMGQAGIETEFIMSNLSLLLGGGVFAFALGYGIASKDMMANFLASFYSKDKVNIGDKITVAGVTGEVVDIDNNSILVQTADRRVFIPLKTLSTENLEIHD